MAGAGIRIQVTRHWHEPLLLWQALVGGPSSGRSAAFARVRALLAAVGSLEERRSRGAFGANHAGLGPSLRGAKRLRAGEGEDLLDWMEEAQWRVTF